MNKRTILVGLGVLYFVLALALPSTFGIAALGGAPPLSVAQGNVYDIYATNPSTGASTLVASCQPFSAVLADQSANPSLNYAGIPDSACGPIVLVTSTVVSSTTFSNGPGVTCPPQGAPAGNVYVCNGTTTTVTGASTSTSTSTVSTSSASSSASGGTYTVDIYTNSGSLWASDQFSSQSAADTWLTSYLNSGGLGPAFPGGNYTIQTGGSTVQTGGIAATASSSSSTTTTLTTTTSVITTMSGVTSTTKTVTGIGGAKGGSSSPNYGELFGGLIVVAGAVTGRKKK